MEVQLLQEDLHMSQPPVAALPRGPHFAHEGSPFREGPRIQQDASLPLPQMSPRDNMYS